MASPAELQCIAALEALACGTPVVVSNQVADVYGQTASNNGEIAQADAKQIQAHQSEEHPQAVHAETTDRKSVV